MDITDSKKLTQAIDKLNEQKKVVENKLLSDFFMIHQYMDPVYQINKILPRKLSTGEGLNNLIDNSIEGAADAIKLKFNPHPKDSFTKIAGNNLLKNAITMTVNKNSFKIKAIGLAILKNVFT